MYKLLAVKYRYTPQQIAEMTYEQQLMLLEGSKHIVFDSIEEYEQWLQAGQK